jgi:Uncharacterized protein conserved in bacteria (DUF2188)
MSQWIAEILSRAVTYQEARLWFTQGDWLNNLQDFVEKLSPPSSPGADVRLRDHRRDELVAVQLKTQTTESREAREERAVAHKPGRGKDVHVTPRKGGDWAVKKSGAQRASSVHAKKTDAVKVAREASRKEQSELVVHNRDGRIANKDSHGHDPRRSKG